MSGDELHLWQWRYTDEFGKRRVFPCRLTEEAGKKLKDAERVEGTIEIPEPFHTGSLFFIGWPLLALRCP